jgi:glutaconyl-CoA/methylmalonyl-CoA decarboxylase subunit gamma
MSKYKFKIEDRVYDVEIVNVEANTASVQVNGKLYEVEVDRQLKSTRTPTLVRKEVIPSTESSPTTSKTTTQVSTGEKGILKSPLPGKILDVMVKPGDKVVMGQTVVCLEAMKMENNIKSDKEGTVINVAATKGSTVMEGDTLIELG